MGVGGGGIRNNCSDGSLPPMDHLACNDMSTPLVDRTVSPLLLFSTFDYVYKHSEEMSFHLWVCFALVLASRMIPNALEDF